MAVEKGAPLVFRLDYSTDGGLTWLPSTPVYVTMGRYSVTVVPEEAAPTQKFQAGGRIRPITKGRIKVVLEVLGPGQINGTSDAAQALLAWLDDYTRFPLLRISHAAGVTINGRNYFASASNTVYLVDDGESEEPDLRNSAHKRKVLVLKSRDWV